MHDRHTPHNNTHNNAHIGHDSHRELQTKLAMRLMAGMLGGFRMPPPQLYPILMHIYGKPQIHNANEQQILVARPSPKALTQSLYMSLLPSEHIHKCYQSLNATKSIYVLYVLFLLASLSPADHVLATVQASNLNFNVSHLAGQRKKSRLLFVQQS